MTNKAISLIVYGLKRGKSAAIFSKLRKVLLKDDGGFIQNIQELGTLAAQNAHIKIFILDAC